MVKSAKIIATLGVAAGLGVALLPIATYAETTNTQTIKVRVEDVLELSVDNNKSGTVSGEDDNTRIITMEQNDFDDSIIHDVRVKGNVNAGYTLKMAAAVGALKDGDKKTPISSIDEEGEITAGDGKWGYKYKESTVSSFTGDWQPIPITDGTGVHVVKTLKSYNNSTALTTFDDTVNVNFGIATGATQAAGTYSDTVTYTVTAGV